MVGILLAAGFSRRFGSADKLLQRLPDGRPLALAAAEHLIQALPLSIAAVRQDNKALAEVLSHAGLQVVLCTDTELEMADSLVTAIRHSMQFEAAKDGFVIALADMPYIKPATISQVAAELRTGAAIVIPTYQGQRGHPVGFSAKFRHALENLHGDEGARSIIKHYPEALQLLATEDAGILADIDTPQDLDTHGQLSGDLL